MFLFYSAIRSAYGQEKYEAVASFSGRWLNTKPDDINPATTARLALANYELNNFLVSYKLCDTLMKQGIMQEKLVYYAARALHKLGRYKESNELLRECLDQAISKNAESYFFERAENFESLKNYKASIAACDTAYYLFQNPSALYTIGRLYETGFKSKDKALIYYKRYLKKSSPSTAKEKEFYAYVKEMLARRETK